MAKIPVVWDGLTGLPGVSVFYSTSANAVSAVAALTTFFNAIKAQFPSQLSWSIPSSGDTVTDTDGSLNGSWSGATGSTITATGGAGQYAAGVGASIQWNTVAVMNRRRVRGRTYLVPLYGTMYDTNGTISNTAVGVFQSAANALVTADLLGIWHRPSPGGNDGAFVDVVTATVADKVSTLRTRRT